MSLDCYPFGERQSIGLAEQPMAIDVAYDDDLFICIIDNCKSVAIFELSNPNGGGNLIRQFEIGEGVVVDQVVYCKTGDYIACVGHNNGFVSLYTVFRWRLVGVAPIIQRLDMTSEISSSINETNRNSLKGKAVIEQQESRLNSICSCQKTGNLAVSLGDVVQIYKFLNKSFYNECHETNSLDEDDPSGDCIEDSVYSRIEPTREIDQAVDLSDELDLMNARQNFQLIICIKLNMMALKVCLVENYLSITAIDHVQVLKLELLTLQIQSDSSDADQSSNSLLCNGVACSSSRILNGVGGPNGSGGTSGGSVIGTMKAGGSVVAGVGVLNNANTRNMTHNNNGGSNNNNAKSNNVNRQSETTASTSQATTSSMISDSNSTTGTNFSTLNGPGSSILTGTGEQSSTNCNNLSQLASQNHTGQLVDNNEMSFLTMNNLHEAGENLHPDDWVPSSGCCNEDTFNSTSSNDDCITWNLNTKKLVKLPTLMHNTSNDLSSFHICHPLELLGPASESIACRVEAKLYSQDYCRNQLEPVVMLCKQFDLDKEPIKSAQLQAIYLSSLEDQRRLASSGGNSAVQTRASKPAPAGHPSSTTTTTSGHQQQLLKSADYELIASVSCFVATLTNCFVYSLSGKKVVRIQSITHPDLCLDFRPDLLNVYLLTPMGLQICSTGACDSEFRYDWSSSSDLNLNFVACNQTWRCLTSRSHIILVSSSAAGGGANQSAGSTSFHLIDGSRASTDSAESGSLLELPDEQSQCCLVEFMRKPSLIELGKRIVHTVARCNSVSIRSNLITYLHASAQLELFKINQEITASQRQGTEWALGVPEGAKWGPNDNNNNNNKLPKTISLLKWVTIFLCKQLIQKKQTNVITNQKLDKQIKHLLDISYCDLAELMKRYLEIRPPPQGGYQGVAANSDELEQTALDSTSFNGQIGRSAEQLVGPATSDPFGIGDQLAVQETLQVEVEVDEQDVDWDHERPVDFLNELIKIYLRHEKHSQPMVDYLISITCSAPPASNYEFASNKLIAYLYEFNPRLLIKCAQKYTNQGAAARGHDGLHFGPDGGSSMATTGAATSAPPAEADQQPGRGALAESQRFCLELLGDRLKQLAELDSTGINRATVLFTLAIIHHQLGHRDQCLAWLGQIKPLRHLAITMCSNYEISHSIVNLVAQQYPNVFELFLKQLSKRDPIVARQFASRLERADQDDAGSQQSDCKRPMGARCPHGQAHAEDQACHSNEDEDDDFEQRLRLIADIAPVELADLFIGAGVGGPQELASDGDSEAICAYLKASINLLEAQFILTRLCENSN